MVLKKITSFFSVKTIEQEEQDELTLMQEIRLRKESEETAAQERSVISDELALIVNSNSSQSTSVDINVGDQVILLKNRYKNQCKWRYRIAANDVHNLLQ